MLTTLQHYCQLVCLMLCVNFVVIYLLRCVEATFIQLLSQESKICQNHRLNNNSTPRHNTTFGPSLWLELIHTTKQAVRFFINLHQLADYLHLWCTYVTLALQSQKVRNLGNFPFFNGRISYFIAHLTKIFPQIIFFMLKFSSILLELRWKFTYQNIMILFMVFGDSCLLACFKTNIKAVEGLKPKYCLPVKQ